MQFDFQVFEIRLTLKRFMRRRTRKSNDKLDIVRKALNFVNLILVNKSSLLIGIKGVFVWVMTTRKPWVSPKFFNSECKKTTFDLLYLEIYVYFLIYTIFKHVSYTRALIYAVVWFNLETADSSEHHIFRYMKQNLNKDN